MIDLPPTDFTCVYSTLKVVEGLKNSDFCENYIFFKVTLFLIEIYRRIRILIRFCPNFVIFFRYCRFFAPRYNEEFRKLPT